MPRMCAPQAQSPFALVWPHTAACIERNVHFFSIRYAKCLWLTGPPASVKVMHENQVMVSGSKVHIGANTLRVEPPNLCLVTYVGVLDSEVIGQMNTALMDAVQRFPRVFLIVDLSRVHTVTQVGRRHGASGMLVLDPAATAVISGSFHMRVVVEMITKAAKLLNKGIRGPVGFCATETEAREWIARKQQELREVQ